MKNKRNLIQLCLLGALLLPAAAQAQFGYTTLNGEVTITSYTGSGGVLVIPDTINGLPVVAIASNVFNVFGNPPAPLLTGVTIGTNVTLIGDNAFWGQYAMTSILFPQSLTSIGTSAFEDCGMTSLIIPNGVTNIGDVAFNYSEIQNVTISSSLTSLGLNVFGNCNGLTSVSIPNGVGNIRYDAFVFCTSLKSVTIGNTVTNLEADSFYGCSALMAVYFRGNPPTFGNQTAFNGDTNVTTYYPIGTTGWNFSPLAPYFIVRNAGFDDTGDFSPWTVAGTGSAQVTGPNVYSGPYAAAFNETAATLVNGTIVFGTTNMLSQSLPTQAGASYVLSFAVNGILGGYCYVSWDGYPVGQNTFNPGWAKFQFEVTARTTNTVLQFYIPDVYNEVQTIAIDSVSVLPLPQIAAQRISGGQVQLSAFTGTIGATYALDRATSLIQPINWVQQSTASSDALGNVNFTTTPSPTANNFWRFRSVP